MSSPGLEPQPREYARYSNYRDLSIVYEGHSESIAIRTPDFSPKGMFIHIGRYFPQGTVLKVRFRLGRTGYEVRARGEVRYCLLGVGIGVEFVDMSPEDRHAIEDELGIPPEDSLAPDDQPA